MNQPLTLLRWIIPVAIILVGWFAGVIFERVFFKRLKQVATKTQFPGNELVFKSLHRMPSLWFLLAGLYCAVFTLPINPAGSGILQKALTAVFLYTVTLVIARIAAGLMTLYGQRIEGLSASLLSNLVRIVVITFGVLMILQALGISITPILATLGIGGLAVALAFQDTLSNLFSGLYLIISGQVRTGDYVRLETGEEGYVSDITWRNTTIKELANNLIIVPNTKLGSAIFKNFHLPVQEIVMQVAAGVSYDSNLEQVEQVTLAVAREVMQTVPGGVPDFEPFLHYQDFEDFRINFIVFLRVQEFFNQRLVKHEFIKRLHSRYREEGIEIPFVIRNVYLKDKGRAKPAPTKRGKAKLHIPKH
ncbi:MAG TPA: mechanosensitive ion channel family protein [Coleofasciculaceae cyanobacterium]|jgi:small-conductance mechanosensitive channel